MSPSEVENRASRVITFLAGPALFEALDRLARQHLLPPAAMAERLVAQAIIERNQHGNAS